MAHKLSSGLILIDPWPGRCAGLPAQYTTRHLKVTLLGLVGKIPWPQAWEQQVQSAVWILDQATEAKPSCHSPSRQVVECRPIPWRQARPGPGPTRVLTPNCSIYTSFNLSAFSRLPNLGCSGQNLAQCRWGPSPKSVGSCGCPL